MNGNVGVGTAAPYTILSLGYTVPVVNTAASRISVFSDSSTSYGIGLSHYNNWGLGLFSNDTHTGTPKVFIENTGNVGIGTTNPQAKLQVEGSIVIPSFETAADVLSFRSGIPDGTNVGIRAKAITTANRDGLELLGYNGIDFSINNGSTVAMHINGTGATGPGNVGVGVTNPYAKLTIHDGTDINLGIKVGQDVTSAVMLNAYNDAVTANIPMELRASKFMFQFGNVGIGTTNPIVKLEVPGSTINSSAKFGTLEFQSYGINNSWLGENIYYNAGFKYRAAAKASAIYFQTDGGIRFWVSDAGAADGAVSPREPLAISNNGNIGINTTAPNDKLSIGNSGAAPAGSAATGHNYTSTYLGTDNYALVNYGLVNTLVNSTNLWSGTKDGNIWNGTAGAGYVGIGTTNPVTPLHVSSAALTTFTGAGRGALSLVTPYNGGTPSYNSIDFLYSGNNLPVARIGALITSAGSILTFGTSNDYSPGVTNTAMAINIIGNVGIGTTAPSKRFSVSGASEVASYFQTSGTYAPISWSGDAGTTKGGVIAHSSYVGIGPLNGGGTGVDGDKSITITNGGNVGIGTTNPGAQLDLAGSATTALNITSGHGYAIDIANNVFIREKDTAGTMKLLLGTSSNNDTYLRAPANLHLQTSDGGSEVTILSNGNVGIGSASPAEKLDISGNFLFNNRDLSPGQVPYITIKNTVDNPLASDGWGYKQIQFVQQNGSTVWEQGWVGAGLKFTVNGNGSLFLKKDGNVGIGWTAPVEKLQVGGTIKIGTAENNGTLALGNISSAGYYDNGIYRGGIGSVSTGNYLNIASYQGIAFTSSNAAFGSQATRMFIDGATGNVGIGVTAADSLLQIGADDGNTVNNTPALLRVVGDDQSQTDQVLLRLIRDHNPGVYYPGTVDFKVGAFDVGGAGDGYIPHTKLTIALKSVGGWDETGNVDVMTLFSTGNVTVAGSVTATAFIYSSDRNLKQNIATISNPLDKILQLRGVTFNWKKDNKPSMGLIAQEVEQVFPELVTGQEGSKAVQYGNLVAPLIEAVKAQQTEIKNNNEEIAKLKAQQAETIKLNTNLLNRLKTLEVKSKKK